MLEHEGARRSLCFARLDGSLGKGALAQRPELAAVDSVVWYEPDGVGGLPRTLVRSDAAIAVLRYLGGGWAVLGLLLAAVPRFMRDGGYDFVAKHRHRIAGRGACVIPAPDQRARFLDPDG